MKFSLTEEQRSFADALDALLSSAGVSAAARAWADGDAALLRGVWKKLGQLGATGLLLSEDAGGFEGTIADMTVAFDRIGYHGLPGPTIESFVLAPLLLRDNNNHNDDLLSSLADGTTVVTVAAGTPSRAADAGAADEVLIVDEGRIVQGSVGQSFRSVDPTRRLFDVSPSDTVVATPSADVVDAAYEAASLASSALLVGAGYRLLDETVTYIGQRKQFGRIIGEYQALKHAVADVRVALDFAQPLILGAALAFDAGSTTVARDVSAAKVAASDAASLAARTALQLHGAVGYTAELDLSLWLLRVRALIGAWGTPQQHRSRILSALVESR